MAATQVLDALRRACGGQARPADDADAVAGVPPRFVAAPATTPEASNVLAVAAQHGLRVVARGSGTKIGWGAPPAAVDLVLDTTAMSGVAEHVAGDLVCAVRAGTSVTELQAELARADQQLALDVPFPAATVGGTIATATSGPRRVFYGTTRDLLIGVTFVRADGVVAKAGGKVVKNVAGYDFAKLLNGSYGTLGVITEAVFRLHPLPLARRIVGTTYAAPSSAARCAAAVLGSQLAPTAVEVSQLDDAAVGVTVLLEGVESGVRSRAADALALFERSGSSSADCWSSDTLPQGFSDLPFAAGDIGLKLTCTVTGIAHVLETAARLASARGISVSVRGTAAGVLHVGLPATTDPSDAAGAITTLRAAAAAHDGFVTVLCAPSAVRDLADVWGPVPGLHIMKRLKAEMDPEHRLAPGRFVGGI